LLAGALAAPSFWEHHFVALALAAAGLWSVLAGRSRYARLCTWVCLLTPLVATTTVPFFVALFSAGFESTFYLALREYGFPTAAAVNVLVVGIAVTVPLRWGESNRPSTENCPEGAASGRPRGDVYRRRHRQRRGPAAPSS